MRPRENTPNPVDGPLLHHTCTFRFSTSLILPFPLPPDHLPRRPFPPFHPLGDFYNRTPREDMLRPLPLQPLNQPALDADSVPLCPIGLPDSVHHTRATHLAE